MFSKHIDNLILWWGRESNPWHEVASCLLELSAALWKTVQVETKTLRDQVIAVLVAMRIMTIIKAVSCDSFF